jgi:DNA-directed RNA polymerase specialized sigma24 family protein
MRKDWVLTQEALDGLFDWLDEDRQQAALEYEKIRRKLIRIFVGRRCHVAEELADETINRVTVKVQKLVVYEGDKALYFYAVANNVYREWLRDPARTNCEPPVFKAVTPSEPNEDEDKYECLERCWKELNEDSRSLFLEYNREEKSAKIKHRHRLAQQYGIASNALRIRAHRVRARLKQCVTDCLEQMPAH